MSKCPFWSTTREKVECYRECPILSRESSEGKMVNNVFLMSAQNQVM